MGEVYRARDSKLGREVALKVLPDSFTADPDRLARFAREARVLASLNHPNIAAIHGLEESSDTRALVLELVEGPTLAELIELQQGRGLPQDEVLAIAHQIVDALEAAHEQGIIHRDLKPANIKVTMKGGDRDRPSVKVLDFGLARAMDEDPASGNPATSPTMTGRATQLGMILGTAAYMAPEQARGKTVDKRADVWAFGCVLFEMLTGRRVFEASEISDTLAFVLTKEPDWSALPAATPAALRRLLRRCLAKDRRQRLSDIADARLELAEAAGVSPDVGVDDPRAMAPRSRSVGWPSFLLAGAGAAALATAVAVSPWMPWRSRATVPPPIRLSADLDVDGRLTLFGSGGGSLALSPDGSTLAFAGEKNGAQALYLRPLNQLAATELPGTTNATQPFFSPDGQWIAFFADNKLKRIPATGGPAVTLADANGARGGTWGDDGTIFFSASHDKTGTTPVFQVPATGGVREPATTLAGTDVTHRWPHVLPGGKALLYIAHDRLGNYDDARLLVQPLPQGPAKTLHRGATFARYLASGHIVYAHRGTLFAAPFDVGTLELTGSSIPVIERVYSFAATGGAQFAVAANGSAIYAPGGTSLAEAPIHWVARTGATSVLHGAQSNWSNPQFSPDGTRLAFDLDYGAGQREIAVLDLARGSLTRLTYDDGQDRSPVWTPDGRRIVFRSDRGPAGSSAALYWVRSDGTGEPQRLTEPAPTFLDHVPGSWHPNGRLFAFEAGTAAGDGVAATAVRVVWLLPMNGDETTGWRPGKPYQLDPTSRQQTFPSFSPDGRWLAYQSLEGGRPEIVVRPFPAGGGRWIVSTNGGAQPSWSRTTSELLYLANELRRVMSVPYSAEGDWFRAEAPRPWTEQGVLPRPGGLRSLSLHPDGERIAAAIADDPASGDTFGKAIFISNFSDEVRRLAPARR